MVSDAIISYTLLELTWIREHLTDICYRIDSLFDIAGKPTQLVLSLSCAKSTGGETEFKFALVFPLLSLFFPFVIIYLFYFTF